MRHILLLISALSFSNCSEETGVSDFEDQIAGRNIMTEIENISTLKELRAYLNQRYDGIEELPIAFQAVSGQDTIVPFKYRLQDQREFEIPIIFTASNEVIVDPNFNFESLPN